MKLSDIEMDYGKPLPQALLNQESDSHSQPRLTRVVPVLKNRFGVFESYFVDGLDDQGQRLTSLATLYSSELVGLEPGDEGDFTSDGDHFYINFSGGNKGKGVALTRKLISPVLAEETGWRTVEADNLLFTQAEKNTYNPKIVLQNASSMRNSDRQHMFVVAEVPEGAEKLFVMCFAPLIIPGMIAPRNKFENVIVFDNDANQVRSGIVYANSSVKRS